MAFNMEDTKRRLAVIDEMKRDVESIACRFEHAKVKNKSVREAVHRLCGELSAHHRQLKHAIRKREDKRYADDQSAGA